MGHGGLSAASGGGPRGIGALPQSRSEHEALLRLTRNRSPTADLFESRHLAGETLPLSISEHEAIARLDKHSGRWCGTISVANQNAPIVLRVLYRRGNNAFYVIIHNCLSYFLH